MNILLIGASGMVGSRILNEAIERNHQVVAVSRNPEKIKGGPNTQVSTLDVNDADALARHAEQADVIISAVSPRNGGDAVAEAEAFTQALITAQERSGKRVLMVGGGGSLHLPDGTSVLDLLPEELLPEATGMRRAYAMLVSADIDFTVLAPGGMIAPGERTGKFRLGGRTLVVGENGAMSNISAEDFAVALVDELETPKHFRTVFNVAY